ncbi:carboxymuconolactone decarboxylase family protein [Chelativorans sp. M5D2P16]|uniref:carboxymuconolactone decarboxylase family protein n=1 Tax=Chelativorans sp. M5D2P16 TaxID=3095678 RepID=UPI002ACADFE1|nr:carboxymuconolactone decarboxylase family protein [Chelativorans sp. M5D2P16]MDZ5698746.1 carboxymuconolactone decarboxylase family protein [Chelativorans sp. M5D2P16]
MNAFAAAPEAIDAILTLETDVRRSGLEPTLIELVKTRASQLNRCAYCVEMHTREAREAGEREKRLHLLTAWQESSFYTDRERAALAWTEALTLVAQSHARDEVYVILRAEDRK